MLAVPRFVEGKMRDFGGKICQKSGEKPVDLNRGSGVGRPWLSGDHNSFQNIGVATLGWNGLVDGYPCYHRECDTMETMIEYMDTDDSTGINNLVHSWDIVTWWAVYAFLHMDQTPVPNEL